MKKDPDLKPDGEAPEDGGSGSETAKRPGASR